MGPPIMKLEKVIIENYRAIERLELPLHPQLTVLHGDNGHGKTSVLNGIGVGLGSIMRFLPYVTSVDFRKGDRRPWQAPGVGLINTNGLKWERGIVFSGAKRVGLVELQSAISKITSADKYGNDPIDLPIVALYDTDRAVYEAPQKQRGSAKQFTRYAALEGALSARTNFREFFKWFYAMENAELRRQRDLHDFNYRMTALSAVRLALSSMMPDVSVPRIEASPLRFVVSLESEPGERNALSLDQLSGGYRIMLALVADLARRMAQGNPHLDDPLQSEAIVLIDEVDLHLHPSWQQRVLPDLMRTFPNTQFIVSTHSPQVLTTVKPDHIVRLRRDGDGIVAAGSGGHTYGAPASDVLTAVMGVDERPPGNELTVALREYMQLVDAGKGKSETALQLRSKLEQLSPYDNALNRADVEMMVQEVVNIPGGNDEAD